MRKVALILTILCIVNSSYSQPLSQGSFTVGGDLNTFYPTIWKDVSWAIGPVELEINRANTHTDSQWRGSLISKFRFHITNWGHGSNFIDADIRHGKNPFIAGYKDISLNNSSGSIIIWLRGGGTTYSYRSFNANVETPVIYDGTSNSLPYTDPSGSAHNSTTKINEQLNQNGKTLNDDLYVNGNIRSSNHLIFQRSSEVQIAPFYGGNNTRSRTHTIIKNGWKNGTDFTSLHAAGMTTNSEAFVLVKGDGNTGVGEDNPQAKLHVSGDILANEIRVEDIAANNLNLAGDLAANNITVKANGNTADFVFEEDYSLRELSEVENFIKTNKHLPDIPSATEMEEQGVNLAEMNKLLLQKVEELTLYSIGLEKARKREIEDRKILENQVTTLTERLEKIEQLLNK